MDFLSLRRREFETTLRVLQAFPEGSASLKPAAQSRTAAELVRTLATEERVITSLIQAGVASPDAWIRDAPSLMASIIDVWRQAVDVNDRLLSALTPADFARVADFYGRPLPLADALWIELLDHIHHRGQFSVYLRLAGAKVPSIYGPSADYPWPVPSTSSDSSTS